MKKLFSILCFLLPFSVCSWAADVVVTDTICIVTTDVETEFTPSAGTYIYTMYDHAADGARTWKVQIAYQADSQFGNFTDDDLLSAGSASGTLNFLRLLTSDTKFYSLREVQISVVDNGTYTQVEVNALINDWGKWTRVLVSARIETVVAHDTIDVACGTATLVPNSFMGDKYLLIYASSADYDVVFGLPNTTELQPGEYARVELIRPEIYVRQTGDTILPIDASLVVSPLDEKDMTMQLSVLGQDLVLYRFAMQTGEPVATDTVQIYCPELMLLDYTQTYGLYQMFGESDLYYVGLAITPDGLEALTTDGVADGEAFSLNNSSVLAKSSVDSEQLIRISAELETAEDESYALVRANALSLSGTRYIITMMIFGDIPNSLTHNRLDANNTTKILRNGTLVVLTPHGEFNALGARVH